MSALHDRRRKVAAVLRVLADERRDERRVQDSFGYSLPPGHPWADSTLKPTASPGIQITEGTRGERESDNGNSTG